MFPVTRKNRTADGGGGYSNSNHMGALSVQDIIQQVKIECTRSVLGHPQPSDDIYCPALFDGWHCFNHTKAGETAFTNCTAFPGFNKEEMAFRECSANGTWAIHEPLGKPWTNTTNCIYVKMGTVDIEDESLTPIYLFIAGASLSLILLFISLGIFFSFTQLRCDRVVIHQNLFISLVFSAVSWIMYYVMAIMDGNVLANNPVWCQALHIVCQYFMASNFSWMFCESVYLHIIMTYAMHTGKKLIKVIIVCGWCVPLVLTTCYATVRGSDEEASQDCWVHDHVLLWIIAGPICLSILLIFVMLISLICLLVTKLQQIPDAPQSKKAAKAILILVPLFGLQHLMFPVRPEPGTDLYTIYIHLTAFLMSTQGAFVSIIFCFCNGEVRSVLRRKWNQHRLMRGFVRKNTALTSSTYADPYSAMDSRDVSVHRIRVMNDANTKTTDAAVELKPLTSGPEQDC